ncbi:hypothetical protein [Dolosigranulum pigrum]|uniref:hypothetical protein n=1 Tax=Dolosigranulum pigrum TaxID=29394 RepID=UPI001AD88FE9|nr:hypothetical protein [Dolosigranulum pigrum]QTJ46518.1 hypothetical protein FE329_03920 [Dolosigranulum pigrum]QTJ60042.1 hypothetical protein FE337_03990 [Dolosigranulum pigrum]
MSRRTLYGLTLLGGPAGYFSMAYAPQLYFYGCILLFGVILIQTPSPNRVTNERDLERSQFTLRFLVFLTLFYSISGIIGAFA